MESRRVPTPHEQIGVCRVGDEQSPARFGTARPNASPGLHFEMSHLDTFEIVGLAGLL
jgi:hypothetical protein